jgi:hypothetical protein
MDSSKNYVNELRSRIERVLKLANTGILTVEAGISDLIQLVVSNPVLQNNH